MTRGAILYLASFAFHGALAVGVVSLKVGRSHENVAISMVESKKPEKPAPETPPPPPPPEPPTPAPPKAKATPAPKPEAPEPALAAPAANDAPSAPDFGLSLGGASGGSGLAVPAARATTPAASATTERVSKKLLAAPAEATEDCGEPLKKPKVVSITQPAYTPEARDAQIAGKVRVEVTVDATGKVASARVLEGLGHGLDDAALAAARGAAFEPGTKCGKPRAATFVIAIRFAL
jgi:protein TonB